MRRRCGRGRWGGCGKRLMCSNFLLFWVSQLCCFLADLSLLRRRQARNLRNGCAGNTYGSNLLCLLASPSFTLSLALPQTSSISYHHPTFYQKNTHHPPPISPLPTHPISQSFQIRPYISQFIPLPPPSTSFPTNSPCHPNPLALSRNHHPLPSNHHYTKRRPYTTNHDQSLPIAPQNKQLPTAVLTHSHAFSHRRPRELDLSIR